MTGIGEKICSKKPTPQPLPLPLGRIALIPLPHQQREKKKKEEYPTFELFALFPPIAFMQAVISI